MFDFNKVLSGPSLRKKVVTIEGLGEVELTELSGSEVVKLLSDTKKIETYADDQEATQKHLALWASRMLKGSTPSKDEVSKFQDNLSAACISEIYTAGLNVSGGNKEEHEKN